MTNISSDFSDLAFSELKGLLEARGYKRSRKTDFIFWKQLTPKVDSILIVSTSYAFKGLLKVRFGFFRNDLVTTIKMIKEDSKIRRGGSETLTFHPMDYPGMEELPHFMATTADEARSVANRVIAEIVPEAEKIALRMDDDKVAVEFLTPRLLKGVGPIEHVIAIHVINGDFESAKRTALEKCSANPGSQETERRMRSMIARIEQMEG